MKKFEENAFDLLRLTAAFIVMLSHSFRWFDYPKPRWLLFLTDGSIGVMIFFAISGYLIMASYDRCTKEKHSLIRYFANRFVRIYPALLASFVVLTIGNILLFGIDVFHTDYIIYFIKNFIRPMGGAYKDGISNGVLWTLKAELIFYFLVPFIFKVTRKFNKIQWCILILIMWQFNLWDEQVLNLVSQWGGIGKYIDNGSFIFFLYEMLIGCFIYSYWNDILPFLTRKKTVIVYGAIFVIWYCIYNYSGLIPRFGVMHNALFGLMVPPLVIGLGYCVGEIRFKYDISYGIYIYHMIVINCILNSKQTGIGMMIATWCITVICGFLSFVIIEKPCMNIKKRVMKNVLKEGN